ncbi:MAG: nicotinamide-nucleotide adenylyltransferase [Thermoplasmatales archaeon]|nr:MAG: nicotinamide-nucleotide adenylyltransferase [Thermoplasmatales archaeon]
MKALFIGRFQPFHNGHLLILQSISSQYDEIIVGIGSSQYRNMVDNPFSEDERNRMIAKSLDKIGLRNYGVISIPDIHNPPKWVSYVLSIVKDFDVVISNNKFTKQLFSEKGYIVKGTPLFEKERYSGKEIRRRMINGEVWEDLVPEAVAKIIKDINGVQRLRDLLP